MTLDELLAQKRAELNRRAPSRAYTAGATVGGLVVLTPADLTMIETEIARLRALVATQPATEPEAP